MIDINAESLENGKWQLQWWIWRFDRSEIIRFFNTRQFNTEWSADLFAEKSAIDCIDIDEI